jgi:uncharacterized membrane protein YccC
VTKGLWQRLPVPDLGAAGRSLLGVMIAAAAGLHWGSAGAATAAAGAAAIAGAAALQDSPRGPLRLVGVMSIQMGIAVLLGTATSSYGVLFVLVVAGWCFVAGMQWAASANAGLIATAAAGLLVTAPPVPPTLTSVATATALAVGGVLVQAVLIGLRPRRRWRRQRDALTDAYRSLGADARKLATDPGAQSDPAPLLRLRDSFAVTDRRARHRPPAYRAWYGLPQRISVTLTALAGRSAGDPAAADVLGAAAAVLDVLSEGSRSAKRDASQGLKSVDIAAGAVAVANAPLAQRLSNHLHEAVALRFGGAAARPDHGARQGPLGPGPDALVTIGGHLKWGSPILRHAIRLASGTGAGIAIERFAEVPHGYWIALTVVMVLRPETAHTYTRCVGRVAGIAVGIVAVSVVTMMWQPSGLVAAALAAIFLGIAYAVSGFGYVAFTAAIAATVVFLVDVSGMAGDGTLTDELIATLIGGALAVLVHVALPDHSLIRLRQRAGELLKTEIEYAATVIKAFVHGLDHPGQALAAAWERAFRARAAFEAAAGATTSDSGDLRRWLKSYRTALNAVTTSCATLEASLPAQPSPTLSGDFVAAVDEYAEALGGGPTSPGAPWHLDGDRVAAAEQRIREAARQLGPHDTASRVLVAEIGDITRSLVGITD